MTTPPATPPSDDDAPSFSDETWQMFREDSERAIRDSAPKEPSARAREVTARLRQQDAEAERRAARGRRFGRKRRIPAEPPGWRSWPEGQDVRRRERGAWRRSLQTLLIVVAVVLALIVALNPSGALSLVRGDGIPGVRHGSGDPVTLPPETARPSAAPTTASRPAVPTRWHPFAGSPAETWADGAAGIVLPQAKAVGGVSQTTVQSALQTAARYLAATSLDPATLRGGYPKQAIDLIDPRDTSARDGSKAALRSPGRDRDPLMWVTRYQPADLVLVGHKVKVRGRMTFAKGHNGSVAVQADYTFVYPFSPMHQGAGEVSRTIVRRVLDLEATDSGLRLAGNVSQTYNNACGVHDGYVHPAFASVGPAGDPPTGPTLDSIGRQRAKTPVLHTG
jgi:hypothetical protein